VVGGGGKVARIDGVTQVAQGRVDLQPAGRPQRVAHALADPLECRDVCRHTVEVMSGGVHRELLGPEVEALDVDGRDRPVTQLEIQGETGNVDRELRDGAGAVGADGAGERVQAAGEARSDQRRRDRFDRRPRVEQPLRSRGSRLPVLEPRVLECPERSRDQKSEVSR
jgi:hypothetical protein